VTTAVRGVGDGRGDELHFRSDVAFTIEISDDDVAELGDGRGRNPSLLTRRREILLHQALVHVRPPGVAASPQSLGLTIGLQHPAIDGDSPELDVAKSLNR
jgi:hypothetical protein